MKMGVRLSNRGGGLPSRKGGAGGELKVIYDPEAYVLRVKVGLQALLRGES